MHLLRMLLSPLLPALLLMFRVLPRLWPMGASQVWYVYGVACAEHMVMWASVLGPASTNSESRDRPREAAPQPQYSNARHYH